MNTTEVAGLIKTELSHRDNTIAQLRENAKQAAANYASLQEDYRDLAKLFNERQADDDLASALKAEVAKLQRQLDALLNARKPAFPREWGKFGKGAGDMDTQDDGLVLFARTDK